MRRSAIPYSQTQPRCPTYGRGCALIPWAIDDFIKHLDTQYNTQTIQRWKETNTQNIQPKELLKSYCSPIVKLPGFWCAFWGNQICRCWLAKVDVADKKDEDNADNDLMVTGQGCQPEMGIPDTKAPKKETQCYVVSIAFKHNAHSWMMDMSQVNGT